MATSKTKRFFAIEFDVETVKLVEMTSSGGEFQLVSAETATIEEFGRTPDFHKKAAQKLTQGKNFELSTKLLAVNDALTCLAQHIIPKVPQKEIPEILKWKLKDDVPFALEEAVIDYRLFELSKIDREFKYTAIASATPKSAASPYLKILSELGFPDFVPVYASLTVANFPNAFEVGSRQMVAVITIGEAITEIAFYAKTKLSFLRKINFGCALIHKSLQQPFSSESGRVQLSESESKQIVKQIDVFNSSAFEQFSDKRISVTNLYALVRPEFEKLTVELRRSFDYYTQSQGEGIERIYLAGAGSNLKGLDKFLELELHIPTKFVDFSNDISIPNDKGEYLPAYFRPLSAILDRAELNEFFGVHLMQQLTKPIYLPSYPKIAFALIAFFIVIFSGLFVREQMIKKNAILLKSQAENLNPGFEYSQKIRQIEKEISKIKLTSAKLLEREPSWIEIFREVSHAIPDEATLDALSYDGYALTLKGKVSATENDQIVGKIIQSLKGPVLKDIALVSVEKNIDQPGSVFTIRCEVA